MKSNKKFPPALGAVVGQALKDYSAWMKETVQGIPCEAIEKSGLFQEDTERCVCLTLDEAEQVKALLDDAVELHDKGVVVIQSSGFKTIHLINERIKQVKMSIAST